ncbi:MAG TPA: ethanolamine ammonia-lyase reactivating factor EutA [Candidatus Binatia bacterium]|jgi:ethanolamine utilization protein EutA|nr:ethanolamine ammonia-lyase reactivating factor EutA [Candidatus Binatia bacterium]
MELTPGESPLLFHEGHEDDDYEHEDGASMPLDEEHPMWRSERIALTSVGIDIGSSTSHLIFSRLVLRRQGAALSSRFVVVKREIISESPILLTPYVDKTTIDTKKLDDFIREAYERARLTPNDIDTGALIVTGEAAKKKNAAAIAALFSAQAGKFVCATAGHNLEAILAAYGSGAVAMTFNEGGDFTVMNVDIGGGTSKIAVVQHGKVIDTAALEVGARLVALDESGRIDRLEDAVMKIGAAAGVPLNLGGLLPESDKEKMARVLCDCLFEVLDRGAVSPLTRSLMLTPEIAFKDRIDAVMFSGGVSEYIYGFEKRDLGDLGNQLGRHVRERASKLAGGIPVRAAEVRIRATVIGASQYTVQVSGNTIYLSDPDLLPLRNLQVVTPEIAQKEPLLSTDVKSAIERALQRFDIQDGERAAALAIHWELGPSYPLIRTLAEGVADAMKEHIHRGQPLVLVFDADIAKLVGNIIEKELLPGSGIISIDGVDLKDFDFIDIGEELPDAKAVPVVIKSLIFRQTERGRGHSHHHHHH